MNSQNTEWVISAVVGIGAWVTAIVLTLLGAAILYGLLDLDEPGAMVFFGIAYLAFAAVLLRRDAVGAFAEQLGIAVAAAGIAMIVFGVFFEAESAWAGFIVAVLLIGVVVFFVANDIVQFLAAGLAICFYVGALADAHARHVLDFAAVMTPLGLWLLLRPPMRGIAPTAMALLLAFPVLSLFAVYEDFGWRRMSTGGTFARSVHIVLFVGLTALHWLRSSDERAKMQTVAFAVVATAVCLLLPLGASAAMLLMMLAFVIGSRPFALLGAALQVQFLIRYYYSLQVTLLTKSLLLVAIGVLLLGAWWLLRRSDAREQTA